MANDTLTLRMDGEVPLNLFADAMGHFTGLIASLTKEVAAEATIEWVVTALEGGSAEATILGLCAEAEPVQRVVNAYGIVGTALSRSEAVPYSGSVAEYARALTGILDGKITRLRFETDYGIADVTTASAHVRESTLPPAWGTVKGIVQTLTNRRRLYFTLYDALFDQAVRCYLVTGRENEMRNAWGKRVRVTGRVVRDPVFGRPVEVRDIDNVEVLDDTPGNGLREAQGIVPVPPDSEKPEITLRRMRDA